MEISEQAKEFAKENNLSEEINQTYIDLVGSEYATADQVEEAYQGEYESDKEFAQEMAEQLGEVDFKNLPWPQYCIDWDYASRDLMMDYMSDNGYYFRNF